MRTLGNIIWNIPFLGFVTAALVFLIGLLFVVTIIAAPIGLGLIQYSKFLLLPFSYDMVSKSEIDGDANKNILGNIWIYSEGSLRHLLRYPDGHTLSGTDCLLFLQHYRYSGCHCDG